MSKKACPVAIKWTPEVVRDVLVECAIRSRPELKRRLDSVPAEPLEDHDHQHTIPLSRDNIRKGKKGDCLGCMWARAADETRGIFSSLIQRRIACTLELDEHGNFRVYRYGVPDMARFTAAQFDDPKFDRSKLKEMSITFKPLRYSRTSKGIAQGRGTGTPRGPNGKRKRNKFANLRKSVQADVLKAIGYSAQA